MRPLLLWLFSFEPPQPQRPLWIPSTSFLPEESPIFFSLQIPDPLVTHPPGTNSPAYIKNIIKVASHFAGNREKPHKRLCIFYALGSNACVLACLQFILLEHKVPSPACFVTCRIFHVARDSPCLMPTQSPLRPSTCGSCSSTGVDLLQNLEPISCPDLRDVDGSQIAF